MAKPIRVLLVDDDPDFVEATQLALEANGCEVLTASSGAEGRAKALQCDPDVIVLDVMMETPTEGFHVARDLKDNPQTADVPIIMLTNVNQAMDLPWKMQQDAEYNPVEVFLEKPVQPNKLAELARQLAKSRSPRQSNAS